MQLSRVEERKEKKGQRDEVENEKVKRITQTQTFTQIDIHTQYVVKLNVGQLKWEENKVYI